MITLYPSGRRIQPPAPTQPSERNESRHRQAVFVMLNENKAKLKRAGLTVDDVKAYYRQRLNVPKGEKFSQRDWAIMAAEVRCMLDNREVLRARAKVMKGENDE